MSCYISRKEKWVCSSLCVLHHSVLSSKLIKSLLPIVSNDVHLKYFSLRLQARIPSAFHKTNLQKLFAGYTSDWETEQPAAHMKTRYIVSTKGISDQFTFLKNVLNEYIKIIDEVICITSKVLDLYNPQLTQTPWNYNSMKTTFFPA